MPAPAIRYVYDDPLTHRPVTVDALTDIPARTLAFPIYRAEDGQYFSVGTLYVYEGHEISEQHGHYTVHDTGHTFRSAQGAMTDIDRMNAPIPQDPLLHGLFAIEGYRVRIAEDHTGWIARLDGDATYTGRGFSRQQAITDLLKQIAK